MTDTNSYSRIDKVDLVNNGMPIDITGDIKSVNGVPVKALHYSSGKSGVDQLPPDILLELGEIYAYGEKKYARNNWLNGNDWHEFIGSALRHIYRWMDGEDIDPESNLPHLAHAAWNIMTLRYYQRHDLGNDDRISTIRNPQTVSLDIVDKAMELSRVSGISFDQCLRDLKSIMKE